MKSTTLPDLSLYGAVSLPKLLYTIGLLFCLTTAGCSMPDGEVGEPPAAESSESSAVASMEENAASVAEPEITLNGPGQLLPITATAEVRGQRIELEVAQTQQQQALGLMFRSALPDNRGMLFPLGSMRRARFWMKDVPVPLDMVFLRNDEVVTIVSEVPPCANFPCPSYGPETELVNQVIELRSGRAAEIGILPGDRVVIAASPTSEL